MKKTATGYFVIAAPLIAALVMPTVAHILGDAPVEPETTAPPVWELSRQHVPQCDNVEGWLELGYDNYIRSCTVWT